MSEEWGPWIEHDGQGCPCVGEYCEMKGDRYGMTPRGHLGYQWEGIAKGGRSWFWDCNTTYARIIAYRIREPRGLTILQGLLADMPEKVSS